MPGCQYETIQKRRQFQMKGLCFHLFLLCVCLCIYDKLMALGIIKLVDFVSADFSISQSHS